MAGLSTQPNADLTLTINENDNSDPDPNTTGNQATITSRRTTVPRPSP